MYKYCFEYKLSDFFITVNCDNENDIIGFDIKFEILKIKNNSYNIEPLINYSINIIHCEKSLLIYKELDEDQRIHTTFKASKFYKESNKIQEIYKDNILVINNYSSRICNIYVVNNFNESPLIIGAIAAKHLSCFLECYKFYSLHASAFTYNNNSIICSAQGGNGKSTTACIAKDLGYYILSDDKVIIDDNKEMILDTFSSVGSEVGTDLSLKRLNVDSSSFVTDNSKIYYKISRSNKSIHNKMLNNNIILYPEMTDNCNTIKKLTFEEAYRKILRINSYYVQIFGVDYMNFLLQLVKTSSNYILILNRKETSYKFVSDLLIFLKNSSI